MKFLISTSKLVCPLLFLAFLQCAICVQHKILLRPKQDVHIYETYQTGDVYGYFGDELPSGSRMENFKLTVSRGTFKHEYAVETPSQGQFAEVGKETPFPVFDFRTIPLGMVGDSKLELTYDIVNDSTGEVAKITENSVMPVTYHVPYHPDQIVPEPSQGQDDKDSGKGKTDDKTTGKDETGKKDKDGKNGKKDEKVEKEIDDDKDDKKEKDEKDENESNGVFENVKLHKFAIAAVIGAVLLLVL